MVTRSYACDGRRSGGAVVSKVRREMGRSTDTGVGGVGVRKVRAVVMRGTLGAHVPEQDLAKLRPPGGQQFLSAIRRARSLGS